MKFLAIILLALIASAYMMDKKEEEKKDKKHFKLQKKMCICLKHKHGICKKLKCCEIYKHVPYKVYTKICKYGKCKYVKVKKHKHEHEKKKHEKKKHDKHSKLAL